MSIAEATAAGAAVALLSRALALLLHRGWFRQGFAGDSSIHWVIIRTLRRHPRARWIEEYVISPEPMSYPTGFHRFAALFPLRILAAWSWLPNLVLWVAAGAAFGGLVAAYASDLWIALAFLVVVPAATVFRGPAIAYLKLSERLAGRLTTAFVVLLLALGTLSDGQRLLLVPAAILVAAAALSSVFARQALGLGLPFLALLWLDWRPLAVLAGGTALALVLGRGRFVAGMRHSWIQWTVVYPQLTKASDHFTAALSHYPSLADLRSAFHDRALLNRIVVDREPLRTMLMYPDVDLLVVLLATGSLDWHWAAPVVVFLALTFLTATRRFNHLGEAYRYLEYGLLLLVPLELALATRGWSISARISVLAALAAWSAVLYVRLVVQGWARALPQGDLLGRFLPRVGLRAGDVVFPVSMAVGADVCARVEGVRSFWWQPGVVATSIYAEFIEELPYLKRDYQPLVERYGVTHVVCDKEAAAQLTWEYDFASLTKVAEDERFVAYAVPR